MWARFGIFKICLTFIRCSVVYHSDDGEHKHRLNDFVQRDSHGDVTSAHAATPGLRKVEGVHHAEGARMQHSYNNASRAAKKSACFCSARAALLFGPRGRQLGKATVNESLPNAVASC